MSSLFNPYNNPYSQNPYPAGSGDWITFQQQVGQSVDPAVVAAKKEEWLEEQSKKLINKIMKYPLLEPQGSLKRRFVQPKFKFQFDRQEDINMRILHSIITVGGALYYVSEIFKVEGEWMLIVHDCDKTAYRIPYEHSDVDLRTPDPQYYMDKDNPMYYIRLPSRQQQQGLNTRVVVIKRVGETQATGINDTYSFMRGMRESAPILWSPSYSDMIVKIRALRAMRLSPAIAFFRDEKGELMAEYRTRRLGAVNDDTVTVDDDDYSRPWIKREVSRIGCSLRRA